MPTNSNGADKSMGKWNRMPGRGWRWEGSCPGCRHTTWIDLSGGWPGGLQVGGAGFRRSRRDRNPSISRPSGDLSGPWACICGQHDNKGCGKWLKVPYPE